MRQAHRAGLIGFGMSASLTLLLALLAINMGKPRHFNALSAILLSTAMGSVGAVIGMMVYYCTREEPEPPARSPLALSPGPQPLDIVREVVGPDIRTQVGAGTVFTALTGGGNTVQTADLYRESRLFIAQVTGEMPTPELGVSLPDPEPAIYAEAYEDEAPEPALEVAPSFYGQGEYEVDPWADIWADRVKSNGASTVSAWE